MNRLVAAGIASCLSVASWSGSAAESAGSVRSGAESGPTLDAVVVTGSYIRRTDTESPSPVDIIDAEQILKSGRTTIADVIRSMSSDNSGTLTQNFSGAMAGGSSGVSLRGLSVDATLVLVDGHRMATYPLADDGQRPFVDISSLPLGIVERVEVLKDGASALYGSDAIAGVVNVITKKEFSGFSIAANLGSSYKADGLSQRVSALYGFGNLNTDGHNLYVNVEYRHSASISQLNRGSYLSQLDLRPYGGNDLRGGIVQQSPPNNGAFTAVGMVAPLDRTQSPAQLDQFYLLPGCAAANLNYSGGCTWDPNVNKKIQPRTAGLNVSAKWSQRVDDRWTNGLMTSFFRSEAEQYRQPNQYLDGTSTVPFVWAGARGALVDQTDPLITQIVLPANHPDNPFNPASPYFAGAQAFYGAAFAGYLGKPALLYAALTDIPVQLTRYKTDVIRVVDDLKGELAGWDATFSAGYVRAATRITYDGFVRASALNAALADSSYRIGQNANLNSAALYATLAPHTQDTATSTLSYLSATGSRTLAPLRGGELAIAVGADARFTKADNPGEPYATEGDILMDGSFYAKGSQTIYAGFVELSAPVLRTLELNAAARVDHYNSVGSAFTPKFGFKWKILPQLALRGTFARGFRAPGAAESGNSGSASSVFGVADDARCSLTNRPSDCGQGYVAVLSKANADLKPERSKSFTLGLIAEPVSHLNLTVDYFSIKRTNEITTAALDPNNAVRGAQQPGTTYPGPIVYYNTPYINASSSDTSGIDGEVRAGMSLGNAGLLSAKLGGTYLIKSDQTIDGTTYHYAGSVGPTALSGATGTPRTRGIFSLDWTLNAVSIGATLNYRSHMKGIDESNGSTCLQLSATNSNCYVSSFAYLDMYGQYRFTTGLQVTANVSNLTNRLAPLNTATYGGTNYNPSMDQAGAVGTFFELSASYHF